MNLFTTVCGKVTLNVLLESFEKTELATNVLVYKKMFLFLATIIQIPHSCSWREIDDGGRKSIMSLQKLKNADLREKIPCLYSLSCPKIKNKS